MTLIMDMFKTKQMFCVLGFFIPFSCISHLLDITGYTEFHLQIT